MGDGILLSSGGLDSTTLAFWLESEGIDYIPMIINYGQLFYDTEISTLREVISNDKLKNLIEIDVSQIYNGSNSRLIKETNLWEEQIAANDLFLPYRNILILTIACAIASTRGLKFVYSGFINSNHAKEIDCSSEFFEKLDDIIGNYGTVEIVMPFRELSKLEVAKIGITLGVPIGKTFSCQVSPQIPCGACPNCVDRLTALSKI